MQILIGAILLISAFSFIGLLLKWNESKANIVGSTLFLAIFLTYVRVFLIATERFDLIHEFNFALYSYLLLFIPLIYGYVKKVLGEKVTMILHLIPFLVHLVFQILRFTPLSETEIYFQIGALFKFIFLAQTFVYGVIIYRSLRRNDARIVNQYSNLGGLKLNWMKLILLFVCATGLVWLISWISFLFGGYKIVQLGFLHFTVLVVVFSLYSGMITQRPALDLLENENDSEGENEHRISISQLSNLITQNELYKDPDFNLKKLGEIAQVPMREVSKVINQETESNFHAYINSFRIADVKESLHDASKDHLTILALAYDAGFNSKSAFNSVFRKMVGMTPAQYKKSKK